MNKLLWYFWYKWVYHIHTMKCCIKGIIQKYKYGCTYSEVIDIDISFFKWVLPRLKIYRNICGSYPSGFYDETMSEEENKIALKVLLDQMISFVELKLYEIEHDDYNSELSIVELTKFYNQIFILESQFWKWFPKLGF